MIMNLLNFAIVVVEKHNTLQFGTLTPGNSERLTNNFVIEIDGFKDD